jgi:dipeptidyl aminopeptidase/acylaminoacyl peptidase
VTESSYTEDIRRGSRVGAQDRRTLVVMNLETARENGGGAVRRQARRSVGHAADPEDGSIAIATVRANDNKDRWLAAVDADTGAARVVDHLHDDAWVRELGGFGPDAPFGFLADQKRLWFLSERDGWMHLYVVDASASGAAARQLTQGRWEITDISLSLDRSRFLLRQHRSSSRRAPALLAAG